MSTRGSLADIRYSILTSRTYVSYALHKNHKLEFNTVLTKLKRLGTDPRGITFDDTETDVLKAPAHYDKWVSALGVESNFFNDRVTNNLVAKFYRYSTDASDADWSGNRQHHAVSRTRWGIANAVKIAINDQSFVRLSGEAATRLPEQEEIFGDGNKHLANFELKAERSLNVNAGYRLSKINKYAFEFNAFYRITRDRILRESYNIMYTQNQNIENVKGTGFESDVTVNILPWLKANVNFTYQDFRIFNSKYKTIEGARLKNTPFFFANAGLNALRENLFQENDRIQAYWFYTFVRQFYLDFLPKELEPDGFLGLWGDAKIQAPNIIPDQHLHTIGFTYFPVGDTFSCGGEIKNILDARVYDNFKIQNMGRSFHFKLTYTLK